MSINESFLSHGSTENIYTHKGEIAIFRSGLTDELEDSCRRIRYDDPDLSHPPKAFFESENLNRLATLMRAQQEIGTVAIPRNPDIPAGFTYFGQFVAHDISMQRSITGAAPVLQLLSLYGLGPAIIPYLYNHYPFKSGNSAFLRVKLRWKPGKRDVDRMNDLALMADARNDQHYLLSQLHLAFIRFHNMLAEWMHRQKQLAGAHLLEATRQSFVWHYQWVIVHQYLKLLVYEPELIDRLLEPETTQFKLYDDSGTPMLMPEFMQAAMRIGHSQIRQVYALPTADGKGVERRPIFLSKTNGATRQGAPGNDMRGFRNNPGLYMDWGFYFYTHNNIYDGKEYEPQQSGAIDHHIVAPLLDVLFLQGGKNNLVHLDLKRSEQLPTGYALAQKLCAALSMDEREGLLSDHDPAVRKICGDAFGVRDLPLWLYVLLEAEVKHGGQRLGILGSHIIAEQIIWVLRRDRSSFVRQQDWKPEKALTEYRQGLPILAPRADEPAMAQMRDFNIQDILTFPDHFISKTPRRRPTRK